MPVENAITEPSAVAPPGTDEPAPPAKKRRVAVILLSIALLLVAGALAAVIVLLVQATDTIDDRDREIKQQQELIDKKETFGAAVTSLIDTAATFNGLLTPTAIPYDDYADLVSRAWYHRWKADALDEDTAAIVQAEADLVALRETAAAEAGSNATASTYESVIDQLGAGYVTSSIYPADEFCENDVLACVSSDDPYTVHFDSAELGTEYMTDWIQTGIAYHEFAHVLQMTNPEQTETALEAFGDDGETMADCYALTYLPGWTLEHRVWTNSYTYWEVNVGYGVTCDESQRQVIRDWHDSLGFTATPLAQ